jgi:hypothetical protein
MSIASSDHVRHLNGSTAWSRRAFLAAGACVLSPPLWAQANGEVLTPEQFGAAGDGRRDDTDAFLRLFDTARRERKSIRLGRSRSYLLSRNGWTGLSLDGFSGLVIDGNDATIRVRALPTQRLVRHPSKAVISISGGSATIRSLNVDLGGLEAAALGFDQCRMDVRGCSFTNGSRDSKSFAVYATRSSGTLADNQAARIGFFYYLGPSYAGYHSANLTVTGNRAEDLSKDLVVGFIKDSLIAGNVGRRLFSGIALSAYAPFDTFSENVVVRDNDISDFASHGFQTDVVGEIEVKNIRVIGNRFANGTELSSGVYMLRARGFEIEGNEITNARHGITMQRAFDGRVAHNRLTAGPAHRSAGLMVAAGERGDVGNVVIERNVVTGYERGAFLTGPQARARGVIVRGNSFADGGWGIWAPYDSPGLTISDNELRRNRHGDLEVRGRNVRVLRNATAGASR